MKKYRVNESEHFNLYSMHDKLKCIEIDMQEAPAHTYTDEQWDEVQERISEVEELMENKETGELFTYRGMLKEWRERYEGINPANGFYQYHWHTRYDYLG